MTHMQGFVTCHQQNVVDCAMSNVVLPLFVCVWCCCLASLHASKRWICAQWHTVCIVILCDALLVLTGYELTPNNPGGYKWSLASGRDCATALLPLGSITSWLPSFIHLIIHPFSERNNNDTEASRLWWCKLNRWRLLLRALSCCLTTWRYLFSHFLRCSKLYQMPLLTQALACCAKALTCFACLLFEPFFSCFSGHHSFFTAEQNAYPAVFMST